MTKRDRDRTGARRTRRPGADRRVVRVETGAAIVEFDLAVDLVTHPLASIPSIGPLLAAQLARAGIRDTGDLLRACGTARDRRVAADATGVRPDRLRTWVGLAGFLQVPGMTAPFAELLLACGVEDIAALGEREAEALSGRMIAVNAGDRYASATPATSVVEGWIRHAGRFPVRHRR